MIDVAQCQAGAQPLQLDETRQTMCERCAALDVAQRAAELEAAAAESA